MEHYFIYIVQEVFKCITIAIPFKLVFDIIRGLVFSARG